MMEQQQIYRNLLQVDESMKPSQEIDKKLPVSIDLANKNTQTAEVNEELQK